MHCFLAVLEVGCLKWVSLADISVLGAVPCLSLGENLSPCLSQLPEAATLPACGPFLRLPSKQQGVLLTHAASSLVLSSPHCSTFKDPYNLIRST